MINLMPTHQKDGLIYARRNRQLIRWMFGILIALGFLLLLIAGSLFYLKQDTNNQLESAAQTNKQLEKSKQEEVLAEVNDLSGNIKLTIDVLSNEVLFSKLLSQIGQVMPPNTILSSLTLDSQLSGGLDLEILSVDYESGVKAQVNLTSDEAELFDKADIGEVRCDNSEPVKYPCISTIRVLFSNNKNSFLKLYEEEK